MSKYINRESFINKKFNMLLIISITQLNNKDLDIAHCLCDCGNKKDILFRYVRRNEVKSCGCLPRQTKSINNFIECKKCKNIKLATEINFPFRNKNKNTFRKECKICVKKTHSINYQKNKDKNKRKKSAAGKIYYQKNKDKILQKTKDRLKNKWKNDLNFRLKSSISRAIRYGLERVSCDKNNQSCLKFLPYSILDLKKHLESLFEPWMNWDNWGTYSPKTWDDNDPLTWTWQIDHIIPHSTFKYMSMEEESFKNCWSLSNLRPLSAKQNFLDGINKIRHI